jgi:hypothetical protein
VIADGHIDTISMINIGSGWTFFEVNSVDEVTIQGQNVSNQTLQTYLENELNKHFLKPSPRR